MQYMKKVRALFSSVMTFAILLSIVVGATTYFRTAPQAHAAQPATIPSSFLGTQPRPVDIGNAATGQKPQCPISNAVSACYTPQQIRRAYNIQPLLNLGVTGKGRTIVIVDVFQSPTLRQDLHLFDKTFGLPNPKLNIIAPYGLTPFNPKDVAQVMFALEITLDVEWAHAIAPDATIDLVLGYVNPKNEAGLNQIFAAVQGTNYAIDHNLGDVISQSFVAGETCFTPSFLKAEHQEFQKAAAKGITLLASAGDTGALALVCSGTNVSLSRGVNFPAVDSLVTGVGGTNLQTTANGTYVREKAWTQVSVNSSNGATGGGYSVLYPRPSYQNGIARIGAYRGVPDVAYNADFLTAVIIVFNGHYFAVNGTSAGSPQWAGIVALTNQVWGKRIGFLNSALYRIGKSSLYSVAFHDITTGNNTFTLVANGKTNTVKGYNAGRGWDPVTGLGTPRVAYLVALLIKYHLDDDAAGL